MRCRYCGDELRSINQKLLSSQGERCAGNPAGRHVGLTDGAGCVYCGESACFLAGKLHTVQGNRCRYSPTGMHCLQ